MFTRRIIGILLVALAPGVAVAMLLMGVRVVTMSSRHNEATGETKTQVKVRWPAVIPAALAATGLVLMLWPRAKEAPNKTPTMRAG